LPVRAVTSDQAHAAADFNFTSKRSQGQLANPNSSKPVDGEYRDRASLVPNRPSRHSQGLDQVLRR